MELYDKKFVYFDWDDKLEGKKGFFSDNINDLKQYVKDNKPMWYGEICYNVNTGNSFPFGFIDDSGNSHCFKFCYYDPYYEVKRAFMEGKKIEMEIDGKWFPATDPTWNPDTEYRIKPENTRHVILVAGTLVYSNAETDDKHFYFEGTKEQCDEWINVHEKFELVMLAWEQGKTIQYNSGHGWEDCCDNNPSWEYNVEYRIKATHVPFDTVDELIKCWEKNFPGNANRPEYTMPLIWIKSKQKNRVYLISDFLFDKCYGDDVGTYESNYKLKDLFNDFTFLDGSIIGKRSK